VTAPAGFYSVPDPDTGWPTFWQRGADGRDRDYPGGERWRPLPPACPDLAGEARRAWRAEWYATTYRRWVAAVAAAIDADPAGAAARFAEAYPDPAAVVEPRRRRRVRQHMPGPSPLRLAAAAQRDVEALLAFALRVRGHRLMHIAGVLSLSEPTARRRVERGRALAVLTSLRTPKLQVTPGEAFAAALGEALTATYVPSTPSVDADAAGPMDGASC
jgi:hypothetical protein